MYRSYNQSREMFGRKRRFDPEHWEIPVDPEHLYRFPSSEGLHHESEEDARARQERTDWVRRAFPVVEKLIEQVLTDRQKQIVRMYFPERMTEKEIAGKLGLSTTSVSQHLFGKVRGGKRVGGAIPKLRRRLSEDDGWDVRP